MTHAATEQKPIAGTLTLWDAISLIVGIVIGTVIFQSPPYIFTKAGSPELGLLLWGLGGFGAYCGGLVYAELATTYPLVGGEYHFLTRAFGRWAGFAFGWSQLFVVQTGSIGFFAFVAADYALRVFGTVGHFQAWLAAGIVAIITAVNLIGLAAGRWTQRLLSLGKFGSLAVLIAAGLGWGEQTVLSTVPAATAVVTPATATSTADWPVAMILILYAFGGWNDAAFVVAEMQNPAKNIPRALLLGIGAIAVLYFLANLAYLRALGYAGLCGSSAPATDVLGLVVGEQAARLMSVMVLVSALGGVNGLIFSVSRLHVAVGKDHPLLEFLGGWHARRGVPAASLLTQGFVSIAMILMVGTLEGRAGIDGFLMSIGQQAVPWDRFFGGFDTLFAASAPVFWCFFLMTGLAYFVLRIRDRGVFRPFQTPGTPVVPLLFLGMCAFGFWSAWNYGSVLWPLVAPPLVLMIPAYGASEWLRRRREKADAKVGLSGSR